eukprot:806990-Rhodomonas_salina.1
MEWCSERCSAARWCTRSPRETQSSGANRASTSAGSFSRYRPTVRRVYDCRAAYKLSTSAPLACIASSSALYAASRAVCPCICASSASRRFRLLNPIPVSRRSCDDTTSVSPSSPRSAKSGSGGHGNA